MNGLFLLCEGFEFAALLSQISEGRLQHVVVDGEARKRVGRIEEQSVQPDRALWLLPNQMADLREAHSRLAAESAPPWGDEEGARALAQFTAEGDRKTRGNELIKNRIASNHLYQSVFH
jgi:hypothetical protein